jgi:hypothetical protein
MAEPDPTTRLLWTAGWDSTFRLLVALLVRRKPVQPYYLIDPDRPSTPDELRAMQRIAAAIEAKHPGARGLLRETLVSNVIDVRRDAEITGRFQRLRERSHLGGQYDWLARFATQRGLTDLELAVHQDDKAAVFLQPFVVRADDDGDAFFRLRDAVPDPDLRLFQRFRFPIFDLTKRAMQQAAQQQGFADILELTWFCHQPTPQGDPCGNCNPCRYTIEEGLGRRIPLRNRLRFHRRRLFKQFKRPLRAAARWARLRP